MHTVLLVVDESRNIREFCKRELEREGWQVGLAADPREALRMLDTERHDLVVTDIVEALELGFPAFLRHAVSRDVPVIVHTADVPYASGLLPQLAEACVEKRPDLADLKREIARALERRAAKQTALEDCEPMCSREWEGRLSDEDDAD